MVVVATGGFKLFLTCLQLSKRRNESNQPGTVLSGLLYAVMSVCRHTCFASSANESLWAMTMECPKDISTCAAILAWIAFTARTFVDV